MVLIWLVPQRFRCWKSGPQCGGVEKWWNLPKWDLVGDDWVLTCFMKAGLGLIGMDSSPQAWVVIRVSLLSLDFCPTL